MFQIWGILESFPGDRCGYIQSIEILSAKTVIERRENYQPSAGVNKLQLPAFL